MTTETTIEKEIPIFISKIVGLKGRQQSTGDDSDGFTEPDEMSIILFEVGGSQFALPTMSVTEVVQSQDIVQIPRSPAFIEGIIEIRDQVIPVIDLRKKLGFEKLKRENWIIIVAVIGGKKTGFIVDSAKKVLALTTDELQNLGSVVSGRESRYIFRTLNRDNQPIIILNIDTLLSEEEKSSLAETHGV